ncbi:MAG TPA: MlaD family protein [Thermoanaerobaculia bacterium]|nr:MlaD family protein [Thermoanaerobaculia bacterium]
MSSAAKIGAFMLIILGVLGYFILKIEDVDLRRGRATRPVKIVFDNVAGLDEKSAVRVAGVRKGKVLKIRLLPNGKAEVTLEIDNDVPLHSNANAQVAALGLLGEKYIELNPGTSEAPATSPEATVTLRGSSPASIDQVTNQISLIATDVKAITESLRHAMAGPSGQQRLEDIVDNVRQITAEVRALIATNRENVDATVSNMRAITADLRVEIPKLAASIDRVANQIGGTVGENREDVRKVVENLRTLSSDLRTTTENLNNITGQVKSGQGTVGKLIYDQEAYSRLNSALGSVESGVNELKNTLGRVNRIGLDLGLKADYYAGMNKREDDVEFGSSSRSAVTLRLSPNMEKNRFYNVELADDPRGRKREKDTITTTTDPATGLSRTTVTHETRFDRDYRISAQAGWLLDNLGLRIGLFDNTGGAGVDYQFNPRIRLVGEAFDFGKRYDPNPHVRLFGEYTLRQEKPNTPRIFLTSGVDNAFNDTAFTFGGGIRWRDDDLKYLLGSIPIPK